MGNHDSYSNSGSRLPQFRIRLTTSSFEKQAGGQQPPPLRAAYKIRSISTRLFTV